MRSLQRGAVGALLVTTACAVAACGGGGGSAATTTGTTAANTTASSAGAASGANSAAFAKYAACLKEQGVTLPTRGAGGPPGGTPPTGTAPNPPTGTNATGGRGLRFAGNAKFQKAAAACAKLRPEGRFGGFGNGPRGGANTAEFAAYRNCLTLHGVKLSELGRRPASSTAKATAKVQAALKACASLRPQRQAPPASTTQTPTTTTS